jgi:predicted metallo-beta-lactamase superfamily hydrolase
MHINTLGAEWLGVRGLPCAVETQDGRVAIASGLALGYQRGDRVPHKIARC